jgi:hypothetical protein
MKTWLIRFLLLLPFAGAIVLVPIQSARAQGTAFTYQGNLVANAGPANGSYDFQFALYDAVTNGSLVAGLITNSATTVSNGLFVVTLDFGATPFNGAARWVQIGVRASGTNSFTLLTPRQLLAPTPFALQAATASVAASASSVAATNLSGPLTAARLPSAVVTNNASGVNLQGNISGTFVSPNFQAQPIPLASPGDPHFLFGSFNAHGGTLIIYVSGSGYAQNNVGLIGMNVLFDFTDGNTPIGSISVTANNISNHMAFVPNQIVVRNLPAGAHTLILQTIDDGAGDNTKIDSNDTFAATVLELPF